jgi:hypothetical protein
MMVYSQIFILVSLGFLLISVWYTVLSVRQLHGYNKEQLQLDRDLLDVVIAMETRVSALENRNNK